MNLITSSFRRHSRAAALAAIAFAAPLAVSAQAPAPAAPISGPLSEAVAALRGISTLRADFIQTDRNGQRSNGVLTIKRPGKIRFQYAPGNPLLIVGDGRALTLIDYQVRQVQRWPIGNSPLGALLDPNRDLSRFGRLQPTADANVVSIEVRDRGHPEYGVITLIFVRKAGAPGGLELTSWVALDSQNKRTTIRLSNQQYGIAVSDDTFRWNDPRLPTRR
ncbi:MAG: outer membrane lipoprotein carrier protein LolA [Novosphingobium sp.]